MSAQPYADIVALAKRVNKLREEYNRTHDDTLLITPSMSRLLENDPDYHPYRPRSKRKRRGPITNPTIATLVSIAAALGTSVGDLLGENPIFTPEQREKAKAALRFVADRL